MQLLTASVDSCIPSLASSPHSPDSNWVFFKPFDVDRLSKNHKVVTFPPRKEGSRRQLKQLVAKNMLLQPRLGAQFPAAGNLTNGRIFRRLVVKIGGKLQCLLNVLCSSPAAPSSLEVRMCGVQCDASQFSGQIECALQSNALPVCRSHSPADFFFLPHSQTL